LSGYKNEVINMASNKPSIPKGTRDFSPVEMAGRNYIFDTIKRVFEKYGYSPIETPAMENLSTLLGKYGEEGDKLLFKVLNSGNYLSEIANDDLLDPDPGKLSFKICEKGLRYDLTVPFARYVVQNRNELTFPFKRYQIQPVWRADRPQKGRYREFYQCDADVIGSNSLLNEVELIQIMDEVFAALKIKNIIKINNRKILSGVAETIGESDKITDITIAIDKMEKTGIDQVNKELKQIGLNKSAIEFIQGIITYKGNNYNKILILKSMLGKSATGLKGLEEIEIILDYLKNIQLSSELELDLTLARGLDYYTGIILEVEASDMEIGSICGGGRYDDLTGIFGLPDVSGVGISFGAERIYDVMSKKNLFPKDSAGTMRLMFVNFGKSEEKYCLGLLSKVRSRGIPAEIYPEPAKLKKQMSYANNKAIPFVALVGESEIKENKITIKNMETGKQQSMNLDEMLAILEQI
jgi:histidyl-tRNA synthetase